MLKIREVNNQLMKKNFGKVSVQLATVPWRLIKVNNLKFHIQ